MKILLKLFRCMLQVIYAILKIFPVKDNKVLFLSRQSNQLTLDLKMIQDKLKSDTEDLEIVSICKRSSDSKLDAIPYGIALLKSMYHLATSRICVMDSYWPAVCMLSHKKDLTVIQTWHALGAIKQFGYQTVGKAGGRNATVAKELCMHRNYDYIIAGGKAWNQYYCAAFDVPQSKLLNYGLPRIDYLLETKDANREKVFEKYPEFEGKKILLYAPTFRKGITLDWSRLADIIDPYKYILIIKGHPNQPISSDSPWVYKCDEFSSVELLAACDYLITDYSAIAIEAAVLNVKTFYYVFDYDEYTATNGTNIKLFDEMPGCVFRDAADIAKYLEKPYRQDCLDSYRKKFLPADPGHSTEKISEFIESILNA